MQITIEERELILVYLTQKKSKREIARLLWRSHTAINNEIKRNSVRWKYSPSKANHKAYVRRKYAKKNLKKIRCNDKLEEYIREKIQDDWSPELVAGRWNKDNQDIKISTPTIYKYIYSQFGYDLVECLYKNRKWVRRRVANSNKKWWIKHRTFVDCRPAIISALTEYGHYEWDLIVWPQWTKEVLLVLIEKKSRWKVAKKLPNKRAETVEKVLKKWISCLWIKSITFDNWLEFANHYKLWISTYFANPYHSREKPQVERWNRDYRRFFPKKTVRKKVSQKEIDKITKKLNNMPMKVLKFKSPYEVFTSYQKKHFQVETLTL
jgi:IS30 family transposase